jgi:1-acyl-sn-glycerol-3-phosphate acyltransferase
MSEPDRPERGDPREPEGAHLDPISRMRLYRGGRARARRARLLRSMPAETVARLAALERRVEEALGQSGARRDLGGRDLLLAVLDQGFAMVADARRIRPSAALAALPFGADRVLGLLYDYWWRVQTVGLERVPASGSVILAVNRSGTLAPYEPLMLRHALIVEHPAHRDARPLLDDWIMRLPLVGRALATEGAVRANVKNARRLLARDEALIVYPEGEQALAKSFRQRYRLARFERGGFARLAIETRTPIVPVAVIGAEEVHPVIARLDRAGRFVGLPTLPLTPTFPWLGLAGLLPLPTKWTMIFGEPLDVAKRHTSRDAGDTKAVARLSDQVRERLQALVLEGLRRRRSIFRA